MITCSVHLLCLKTVPFSPSCCHHLLYSWEGPLTFFPIYLSTSSLHPSFSVCFYVPSPPFPLTLFSIFFLSHLQLCLCLLHPTFYLCFFPLPTSFSLICLSSILFSNPHCVSQLKAFSGSYRPVVSLCTIRSALALGFCNSLTSSLPFLCSLWRFFSPPFCLFHLFSWSLCWSVSTLQNMV